MVGIGLFVGWLGYSVLTFGWTQVQGCNAGFVDLIWPGRWKGCNPDAAPGTPAGQVSAALGTQTATGSAGVSAAQAAADQAYLKAHPKTTLQP